MGVLGLIAGFAGVAIIMADRFNGGADAVGIVMCVLGVVALTVATLTVKSASSDGGNLLMVVGLQLMVGSIALLPPALIIETIEVSWSWELVAAFILHDAHARSLRDLHLVQAGGADRIDAGSDLPFPQPGLRRGDRRGATGGAAVVVGRGRRGCDHIGHSGGATVAGSALKAGVIPLYAPPYTRPCIRADIPHTETSRPRLMTSRRACRR
jgi:hypothetical protein